MHDEAPTATATASPTGFAFSVRGGENPEWGMADEVGGVVPVVYCTVTNGAGVAKERIGRRSMRWGSLHQPYGEVPPGAEDQRGRGEFHDRSDTA